MDYYNLLGVTKTATAVEIKKAYHKCAQLYHPDKNQGDKTAEEKFKNCKDAYDVLSDVNKKRIYDQYGKEGLEKLQHVPTRQAEKTERINIDVEVTLEELYFGTTKTVEFQRKTICQNCEGVGSTKPPITCVTCHGKGVITSLIKQGFMTFQSTNTCQKCHGQGTTIKQEDLCTNCLGKKVINKLKTLNLEVEPGQVWYHRVGFFGDAHEYPNMITGDVVVQLVPNKQEDSFKRVGSNLYYALKINLTQALSGNPISFTHLNKKQVCVKSTVIQPGCRKKLLSYGMPKINDKGNFGDLFVDFEVVIDLLPKQIEAVLKVLKVKKVNTEALLLQDVEEEEEQKEEQKEGYHDDFQPQNVNCAQQ
jgi:DnaJ family protein A protein 2